MKLDTAETLITEALRGERAPWPALAGEEFASRLIERATYHGVQQLLHDFLSPADHWPDSVRGALREESIARAMWELRHEQVLRQAIEALTAAGLPSVLIKGSALAYGLYPNPVLRTRGDTDLIVDPDKMRNADRVLTSIGFASERGSGADVVSYHSVYSRVASDGTLHTIEVHSRIGISRLLSNLFPFEDLLARAVLLPRLSPGARAHGAIDGLFITCLHRATHKHRPYFAGEGTYYGANRLIWLYDIHLIASSLAPADWAAFVEASRDKGLLSVAREGLLAAEVAFKTEIPPSVRFEFAKGDANGDIARCAAASHYGQIWIDFRRVRGTPDKLQFLRGLFLPPADFIRGKFPSAKIRWLPWLYVRVLAGVASKWINRQLRQTS